MHGIAAFDFDAEVVERAAVAGVLDQDELQGRFDNGEVRIARLDLGRRGVEQLGVEGDGLVEVVDVEGKLCAGHDDSNLCDLCRTTCGSDNAHLFDICQ